MLTHYVLWGFGLAALAVQVCIISAAPAALPTVDLGYEIHQATLNAPGQFPLYSFNNVRYGQAPVGSLRFAPPIFPIGRNTTVNDGSQTVICPQAFPNWFPSAVYYLTTLREGGNISQFEITSPPPTLPATHPPLDPTTSEDCLFLNVVVSQKIFDNKSGAPVLVWIYGGGFVLGDKASFLSSGNPATLISRSLEDSREGIIYVAVNYRLGLFDLTNNVGLLDQRLALDWVQKNIHLFVGDPNCITIMGESSGGGSMLHQITAFGGKGSVPFQRAIPQSGGFAPIVPRQSAQTFQYVLGNALAPTSKKISTVAQLRSPPFETLADINTDMIELSPYAEFLFGPVVDRPGSFVPSLPFQLVASGHYHEVDILVCHNSNEGFFQAPPYVLTIAEFIGLIESIFPLANWSVISDITTKYCPPVIDGSAGCTIPVQRSEAALGDQGLDCTALWLSSFIPGAYAYFFSIPNTNQLPSGIHGQDIAFTFYNGESAGFLGPIDPAVSLVIDSILLSRKRIV